MNILFCNSSSDPRLRANQAIARGISKEERAEAEAIDRILARERLLNSVVYCIMAIGMIAFVALIFAACLLPHHMLHLYNPNAELGSRLGHVPSVVVL
jgi:hypothetical protein